MPGVPHRRPERPADAVATFLNPLERERVDAVGAGCYVALHRETIDDVLVDLRTRRVSAVLVSVAKYTTAHAPGMARLVREFPRVPAVALLTAHEPRTTQSLLALGQQGVRALVDVRQPVGWRTLRSVLAADHARDIERRILGQLALDLAPSPEDCRQFFEALFVCPPALNTIRALCRQLGVVPSTLMSRFFRSRLPAPKRYLALARLVRAAYLFENPGASVANVANHLDYSSPQSFGRHVRSLMRVSGVEFRHRYDGPQMLNHFREQLMLPYLETLRCFTPLTAPPSWSALRERAWKAREAREA